MVNLIAKTPCDGLLPLSLGAVTLTEVETGPITSISPLKGQKKAVSDALKAACGTAFPAPNRTTAKDTARLIWSGRGQALMLGEAPQIKGAAVTDQSDAWCCVELAGAGVDDVLSCVTPVDTRAMKRGHTARTLVQHVSVVLTRTGKDRFEVMAMRSMATTLVHDLERAMSGVAARG
ncbi:MAG: sarcosine oxidase subunit gamma [Pseudomonadota bacterium]